MPNKHMEQKASLMQILSGLMLFGVSTLLGLLGKPTEMGLAIAAGALGFAFSNIEIIEMLKGPGFEARMRERKAAESVVAEQTDNAEHLRSLAFQITEPRQQIMSALIHTEYQARYIPGVASQTGLPKEVVTGELEWLLNNGLATRRTGRKGYLWNLTEKGMALLPIVVFREK